MGVASILPGKIEGKEDVLKNFRTSNVKTISLWKNHNKETRWSEPFVDTHRKKR